MPNLRNGSKGDLNPGSLDCESGVLPLSYSLHNRPEKRKNKSNETLGKDVEECVESKTNGRTHMYSMETSTNMRIYTLASCSACLK